MPKKKILSEGEVAEQMAAAAPEEENKKSEPQKAPEKAAEAAPKEAAEAVAEEAPSTESKPKKQKKNRAKSEAELLASLPESNEQEGGAQGALPPPSGAALPSDEAHGGSVENAVPPIAFPPLKQERRNFFQMLLLLLGIAAIFTASLLIFLYRPTAYAERTASVQLFYVPESDTTTVVVNGAPLKNATLAGKCTAQGFSENGNVSAAIIGDTLYLIERKSVSVLYAGVADFVLAQNGSAIAFRTTDNLLFYCPITRDRTPQRMSTDTRDARYCLSPNGNELFYTYVQQESTRAKIYSASNNEPRMENVTGLIPVAIANNCTYLYYQNQADGALYYFAPEDELPVICYKSEEPYGITFNRDFSEMLLDTATGTQLWIDGERITIPELKVGEKLSFLPNRRAASNQLPCAAQKLVKSFLKGYYLKSGAAEDGTMLMYLGRNGELSLVHRVDALQSNVTVTDKGVYFLVVEVREQEEVRKHLYHSKKGKTEAECLYWDVAEFCTNVDGSCVMFADWQYALYSLETKGVNPVAVRLVDTVNPGTLCVTLGNTFYYYAGTSLYLSENGDTPRLAREDTTSMLVEAHTAYFFVPQTDKSTYTVYGNHRNRHSDTLILSGVEH